jgi:GNAT superfamily N-acetyltransferase
LKPGVKIRRAREGDAARIAELSGQLGYPATAREMAGRLKRVRKDANAACFVAEDKGEIFGWVHASVTDLLEVDRRAEINGLVVEEKTRSRRTGKYLLEAAENWAREKKCKGVSVRSNVLRERAHRFYEGNGYECYKVQKAFRKKISK